MTVKNLKEMKLRFDLNRLEKMDDSEFLKTIGSIKISENPDELEKYIENRFNTIMEERYKMNRM